MHETEQKRAEVRGRYEQVARAAELLGREPPVTDRGCCAGDSCCVPTNGIEPNADGRWGTSLYGPIVKTAEAAR
jgi:hypothetical protein